MSFFFRDCRRRPRRPTINNIPRRLWWSCLWVLRRSGSSFTRLGRTATRTPGEPVSPSVVAYSSMIFFLAAVSSDTALLLLAGTRYQVEAPGNHAYPQSSGWKGDGSTSPHVPHGQPTTAGHFPAANHGTTPNVELR